MLNLFGKSRTCESPSLPLLRCARGVLCLLLFLSCLLCGPGCSDKGGGKGEIKGKVTLDGQPVAGTVVFIVGDKEVSTQTLPPLGAYAAFEVPKGTAKVKVIKAPGAAPAMGGAKAGEAPGAGGTPMVPPPDKYASADNGLTLAVTGGNQTFDIILSK